MAESARQDFGNVIVFGARVSPYSICHRRMPSKFAASLLVSHAALTAYCTSPNASSSLMVRLGPESMTCVARAAELHQVSVSDYVRSVVVAQARRELVAADQQVIVLAPAEQHVFWQALQEPIALTTAQQALGGLMRGE